MPSVAEKLKFLLPSGYFKPFKHQVEDFERFKDSKEVGLWWEMGLGKTLCDLNLTYRHMQAGRVKTNLIFGFMELGNTWKEAIATILPEAKFINITENPNPKKRMEALEGTADFYFCSYDSIGDRTDKLSTLGGALYSKFFKLSKAGLKVTVDESRKIHSALTARTKAVKMFAELAEYRTVMTGTPMPQGPQDAFGQYWFLDEKVFGKYFFNFRNEWFRMHPVFKGKVLGLLPGKERDFNERINTHCSIRKKKDCSDLPPKLYETHYYSLNPEQAAFYKEFSRDWVSSVRGGQVSSTNALVKSLRLLQACTGFVGSYKEDDKVELEFKKSAKIGCLEELLGGIDGKVIIWCAWHHNVRQVMELLRNLGIKAVDYTGRTEDRYKNELAFRNDDSVRAFVGIGAAGGLGLNLQGPEVRDVIYFSQDYKVEIRQQSEDRAHRGGITHNVTIHDLVCKGTMETAVVKALQAGIKMQDYMMQSPEDFISGKVEFK